MAALLPLLLLLLTVAAAAAAKEAIPAQAFRWTDLGGKNLLDIEVHVDVRPARWLRVFYYDFQGNIPSASVTLRCYVDDAPEPVPDRRSMIPLCGRAFGTSRRNELPASTTPRCNDEGTAIDSGSRFRVGTCAYTPPHTFGLEADAPPAPTHCVLEFFSSAAALTAPAGTRVRLLIQEGAALNFTDAAAADSVYVPLNARAGARPACIPGATGGIIDRGGYGIAMTGLQAGSASTCAFEVATRTPLDAQRAVAFYADTCARLPPNAEQIFSNQGVARTSIGQADATEDRTDQDGNTWRIYTFRAIVPPERVQVNPPPFRPFVSVSDIETRSFAASALTCDNDLERHPRVALAGCCGAGCRSQQLIEYVDAFTDDVPEPQYTPYLPAGGGGGGGPDDDDSSAARAAAAALVLALAFALAA